MYNDTFRGGKTTKWTEGKMIRKGMVVEEDIGYEDIISPGFHLTKGGYLPKLMQDILAHYSQN